VANNAKWIYDTRASRHLCANKELIQDFEDVIDGEYVYMENSTTARVIGKGEILLKFTSGKLLSLSNVLYVTSLYRNLVSAILLSKAGLKTVVGYDKVVISCNRVFVGKEYLNRSLFVLNLTSETLNENASTSTYIAESVDLWYSGLGHVNFASIKWLKNLKLISVVNVDNISKCSVCVEAKYAKKPFKLVTSKQTTLLELVYLDLADFKNTASKGGNCG